MADYQKILESLERESTELLNAKTLEWYLKQIRNLIAQGEPLVQPVQTTTPIESPKREAPKTTPKQEVKADPKKKDPKINVRAGFPDRTIKPLSKQITTYVYKPLIGSMVIYSYDPKHKKTLPYYDRFPLVFPIAMYEDGFLGLNMHYLPPKWRADLFNALVERINTKEINEKSRLNISYRILKRYSQFWSYKPCVKRYLTNHVRSRVYVINPLEWSNVLLLPLANFQKLSEQKVWQESLKKI